MGQYYRGVVLGKTFLKEKRIIVRESFCPYKHENGAKLMEHSYVNNWYVKEFENALADKFFGFPFVWIGDYADTVFDTDIYSLADEFIEKKSDTKQATSYDELIKTTYEYIINLDKKQFVRIPKEHSTDLVIHPLPLLCADGNGRGGGDYDGTDMKYIGVWAYDRIGVGNTLPNDEYTELKVLFKEEY